MKQNVKIFVALALCLTAASCTNYEAQFKALEERIEKLQEADRRTREMIMAEMDKLSQEIVKRIAQMEDSVHDYLDKSMGKVRNLIDSEADKLHGRIESKSKQLGVSITDYASEINTLINSRQRDFEKSRSNLEAELNKAIADNNAALTRRIKNGLANLDEVQKTLPGLVQKTQARMDALTGLEEKYRKVSSEVGTMDARMKAMMKMASDYQDALIDLIASDLDKYASSELQEYYLNVTDAFATADDVYSEIESLNSDLEALYDDMPDLDALLGEAESLFGDLEDLQSALEGYNPDEEASAVLDLLQQAKELCQSTEVSIGALESTTERYYDKMAECEDACFEGIDFLEDRLELMQDFYDTLSCVIDFD